VRRVLVITFHWPPEGRIEVLRWLKFCKYLPEFGWTPVVFVPDDAEPQFRDETLLRGVDPGLEMIRSELPSRSILDEKLEAMASRGLGAADSIQLLNPANQTLGTKAAVWLLSNTRIPDAHASWVPSSVELLCEYLNYETVDAIVSNGPPHSMHLIGRDLKRRLKVPWIADFHRPWTSTIYYDRLPLTKAANKRHRGLLETVIAEADAMVQVAESWAQRLRVAGGKRVETITNGFDRDDLPPSLTLRTDKFRIHYSGLMTADHNHEVLWEALRAVSKGFIGFKAALEIELAGRVDASVVNMATHYGFAPNLVQTGFLTQPERLGRMATAHMLLLPSNRTEVGAGFVPTGLFEYMSTGRPILHIGPPEGDAGRILSDTGTGIALASTDFHGVKTLITDWYEMHKKGHLALESTNLDQYSVRNLTSQLAGLLDEVVTPAS
jgi:glycosyltransferase involved in cell wall biosynthesis